MQQLLAKNTDLPPGLWEKVFDSRDNYSFSERFLSGEHVSFFFQKHPDILDGESFVAISPRIVKNNSGERVLDPGLKLFKLSSVLNKATEPDIVIPTGNNICAKLTMTTRSLVNFTPLVLMLGSVDATPALANENYSIPLTTTTSHMANPNTPGAAPINVPNGIKLGDVPDNLQDTFVTSSNGRPNFNAFYVFNPDAIETQSKYFVFTIVGGHLETLPFSFPADKTKIVYPVDLYVARDDELFDGEVGLAFAMGGDSDGNMVLTAHKRLSTNPAFEVESTSIPHIPVPLEGRILYCHTSGQLAIYPSFGDSTTPRSNYFTINYLWVGANNSDGFSFTDLKEVSYSEESFKSNAFVIKRLPAEFGELPSFGARFNPANSSLEIFDSLTLEINHVHFTELSDIQTYEFGGLSMTSLDNRLYLAFNQRSETDPEKFYPRLLRVNPITGLMAPLSLSNLEVGVDKTTVYHNKPYPIATVAIGSSVHVIHIGPGEEGFVLSTIKEGTYSKTPKFLSLASGSEVSIHDGTREDVRRIHMTPLGGGFLVSTESGRHPVKHSLVDSNYGKGVVVSQAHCEMGVVSGINIVPLEAGEALAFGGLSNDPEDTTRDLVLSNKVMKLTPTGISLKQTPFGDMLDNHSDAATVLYSNSIRLYGGLVNGLNTTRMNVMKAPELPGSNITTSKRPFSPGSRGRPSATIMDDVAYVAGGFLGHDPLTDTADPARVLSRNYLNSPIFDIWRNGLELLRTQPYIEIKEGNENLTTGLKNHLIVGNKLYGFVFTPGDNSVERDLKIHELDIKENTYAGFFLLERGDSVVPEVFRKDRSESIGVFVHDNKLVFPAFRVISSEPGSVVVEHIGFDLDTKEVSVLGTQTLPEVPFKVEYSVSPDGRAVGYGISTFTGASLVKSSSIWKYDSTTNSLTLLKGFSTPPVLKNPLVSSTLFVPGENGKGDRAYFFSTTPLANLEYLGGEKASVVEVDIDTLSLRYSKRPQNHWNMALTIHEGEVFAIGSGINGYSTREISQNSGKFFTRLLRLNIHSLEWEDLGAEVSRTENQSLELVFFSQNGKLILNNVFSTGVAISVGTIKQIVIDVPVSVRKRFAPQTLRMPHIPSFDGLSKPSLKTSLQPSTDGENLFAILRSKEVGGVKTPYSSELVMSLNPSMDTEWSRTKVVGFGGPALGETISAFVPVPDIWTYSADGRTERMALAVSTKTASSRLLYYHPKTPSTLSIKAGIGVPSQLPPFVNRLDNGMPNLIPQSYFAEGSAIYQVYVDSTNKLLTLARSTIEPRSGQVTTEHMRLDGDWYLPEHPIDSTFVILGSIAGVIFIAEMDAIGPRGIIGVSFRTGTWYTVLGRSEELVIDSVCIDGQYMYFTATYEGTKVFAVRNPATGLVEEILDPSKSVAVEVLDVVDRLPFVKTKKGWFTISEKDLAPALIFPTSSTADPEVNRIISADPINESIGSKEQLAVSRTLATDVVAEYYGPVNPTLLPTATEILDALDIKLSEVTNFAEVSGWIKYVYQDSVFFVATNDIGRIHVSLITRTELSKGTVTMEVDTGPETTDTYRVTALSTVNSPDGVAYFVNSNVGNANSERQRLWPNLLKEGEITGAIANFQVGRRWANETRANLALGSGAYEVARDEVLLRSERDVSVTTRLGFNTQTGDSDFTLYERETTHSSSTTVRYRPVLILDNGTAELPLDWLIKASFEDS